VLLPAIQINVRAGHWPVAEGNGVRYLKIPSERGVSGNRSLPHDPLCAFPALEHRPVNLLDPVRLT